MSEIEWASIDTLTPLPGQPSDVPYPDVEWPTGELIDVDVDRLNRELDQAFASDGESEALGLSLSFVAVQGGRLVAERYSPTSGPGVGLISWSMAKSVTQALVGVLVRDGRIDLGPTGLWNDERSQIELNHLLRMRSGLSWREEYVDDSASDVIEMLFGSGAADVAGYAIDQSPVAPPAEHYLYSSGTSNIVAKILGDVVADGSTDPAERESAMRRFMHDELFGPLGMRSADPRFDESGTFVASSYLYATARDFARFGLLYLRDGIWDGQRLLPEGWVDRARLAQGPELASMAHHAEHWWVYPCPRGSFRAAGYEGQAIVVVPALDLVVVRLGKTPAVEGTDPVFDHLAEVISCFC